MRTVRVLSGVLSALASISMVTSGGAQSKQIAVDRLPRVLRAPMAKGVLVHIAPAGNDTVSRASSAVTIRKGELLAARTGETPTLLRVARADSVFSLPFAYVGFGKEGGATPTYRPVYAPQGPLRYSAARDAFEGSFLVGLEDADDPSVERDLARAIGMTFGGDADSIAPPTLQFSRTSQDLLGVHVLARGARDSLGVQIMPRFDPRGVRVWLPVRPALTFEQPPGSVQGFGLESAPLVIGVRGFEPRDSISVTVTAGAGALNTNQVWIGRGGSATVRLRSRGLGPVTLRAVAAGVQPADGATRFAWPVWFGVAMLLGAATGATISELRARRASRARQWRRIAAAMLGALVITAVYVGLGVNLLLQQVDVPLASEIAVFAFAALGALGGAAILAAPGVRRLR